MCVRTGTALQQAHRLHRSTGPVKVRHGCGHQEPTVWFEELMQDFGEVAVLHHLKSDDGVEGMGRQAELTPTADVSDNVRRSQEIDTDDVGPPTRLCPVLHPPVGAADIKDHGVRRDP